MQQIQPVLGQNYNLTSIGLNGIEIGEFANLPLFNPQLGRPYDLTELDLGNTKLLDGGSKNLNFPMQFPNLAKLNVAGNGLLSIFGLNNALKLTELDLSNNALVDIWPLTSLVAARAINLLNNNTIRCLDLDAVIAALPLAVIQRPITCVSNNLPPVASATGPTAVTEGAQVTLSGAGYDPEGSIVAFSWQQISGPAVMLIDASTTSPRFTAPAVAVDTTLTFQLSVSDNNGATGVATISVTVTNVNQPPSVSAGVNQTVNETAPVTLTGSAADPDGTITAYQWTQTGGPAVTLSGVNTPTVTFTAPWVTGDTLLTFQLSVTDNNGAVASATTSVTAKNVSGVDLVVTSVSGSVITIKRGSSFSFTSITKNAGNLKTSTSTTTGLYLSSDSTITTTDTRIGTVWISSVGAEATVKATRTVSVPSALVPGTYYLGAIADYTKRQSEISETNNSFAGVTIQVTQ